MSRVILLLAPSKTMDFVTPVPLAVAPQPPLFLDQATKLAAKLQKLSVKKLMKLMQVSAPIALTVQAAYGDWQGTKAGKPALWSYTGDVYKGVRARDLTVADAQWAQEHLLIASGLYGLVRPYDGIQPYRLEMKAALAVGRRKNLVEFWSRTLGDYVNQQGADWLCNCSSDEYARATLKHLKLPIVTPVFFDTKPSGVVGTVPIYSKMMRGVMARWLIDHQVTEPDQLMAFTAHGYSYDPVRSKPGFPAFRRPKMVPLRFG
ncbi:MAG: YaaA family protein [Patescibacteria group bacterium]|nr:YaaA family protein [Patescibacteria group bacterium]